MKKLKIRITESECYVLKRLGKLIHIEHRRKCEPTLVFLLDNKVEAVSLLKKFINNNDIEKINNL